MKYYLSLFLVLPYFFLIAQSSSVTIDAEDLLLTDIITHLEQENGYLFSFKTADIQDIKVSVQAKNMAINTFLEKVFIAQGLEVEIVNDNYILLKKAIEQKEVLPLLSGKVTDGLTEDGLAYANVYLKKSRKGTTTQSNGKFQLRAKFDSKDSLVISYVGYQEKVLPVVNFIDGKSPTISLAFYEFGEDFIIVKDYLTDGIDLGENGATTIVRPAKMVTMPGQVEPDVLQGIQFLPGISSPDEQASDIYIRGGTPDQNLVLWEDIPIYHSAHYFDMISAFNPYIIDRINVYRSGFGAAHGGRISGVLDLKSDDYTLKKSNFGLGSNLTHTYAYGKTPFAKNKAALVFSFRRSFNELWKTPTFNNLTVRNLQGVTITKANLRDLPQHIDLKTKFYFFDANIKFSARLSAADELSAAWFYGENNFRNSIEDDIKEEEQRDMFSLNNQGTSVTWRHTWNRGFSSKIVGLRSHLYFDYAYELEEGRTDGFEKEGKKRNKVTEQKIQFENTYINDQQHVFNLGYHYTNDKVAYELRQEANETSQAREENSYQADLHALYGEYKSPESEPFTIQAGLRLNYYLGTKKTYVEPRLRLAYQLSNHWSLHANAGQYHQFMSRLIEFKTNADGISNPIWILSGAKRVLNINREIPVLKAQQYQLGTVFDKKSWVVDIQAYYKKISGLTSLSIGFEDIPKEEYDQGVSTIRGIDFLIKKRWKRYRTWLSYTLSKVDYNFPKFSRRIFNASYDQTHFLHWTNMYKIGNLEFSLGWKLTSGKPYTKMKDFKRKMDMSGYNLIYGGFNKERLPLQHRLDASISYHFKTKSRFKGMIGLSFFNIYNQQNIYNREYFLTVLDMKPKIEFKDRKTLNFTPNVVLRVEW